MKNKLNKTVLFTTLILLCGIGFTSCRGGSAKKAAQLVEKYGGKLIKKGEKTKILQYSDDVARKVSFVTVTCPQCNGTGEYLYSTCDECGGDGEKLKVVFK